MKFPPFRLLPAWAALLAAALLSQPQNARAIVDLDSDSLDDVWEEVFGAQSVLPGDDDDGDGHTNLEECIAGTNPFDRFSCHAVDDVSVADDKLSMTISFPTQPGKKYAIEFSPDDFDNYSPQPGEYHGNGGMLTVNLSNTAAATTCGSIGQEIWIGTSGTAIGSLTGHAGYPASPTGTRALPRLETPQNADDNYGGRIRGFVTPPENGDYTFHLASRHSAELLLSTDDDPGNAATVATVDSDTQVLEPKEWDTFASQTHGPVTLVKGTKYYIEVRHIHGDASDHCAVGWSGPGITAGSPDPGPIQVIAGAQLCPLNTGGGPALALDGSNVMKLARVVVQDLDQDGDGIPDWAEDQLASFNPLKSTSTVSGSDDTTTVTNALQASGETIDLSAVDSEAFESNAPYAGSDDGRVRILRTGTLQPVTVILNFPTPYTLLDLDAEPGDYQLADANGTAFPAGSVSLPFGSVSTEIVVEALADANVEYPEKLTVEIAPDAAYTIGAATQVEIDIVDKPDHPDNATLYAGFFQRDFAAVPGNAVTASGVASLQLNGRNDHASVTTSFFGLGSNQFDAHIHRSNAGPVQGPIVYEVTVTPGDPASDPLIGPLSAYPWAIENSSGFTAQQFVDSLIQKPGSPPLYVNKHTDDNPDGETMAILTEVTGSIDFEPPAAEPAHEFLAGDDLYLDTHRFLTQATFGPLGSLVPDGGGGFNYVSDTDALVATIENRRNSGHPDFVATDYSRIDAYDEWIDSQIARQQTYLVDYTLAADMFEFYLRGYFDTANYPVDGGGNFIYPFPGDPEATGTWPGIDHGATMQAYWRPGSPTVPAWKPNEVYPLTATHLANADNNNRLNLGEPDYWNRVAGNWTLYANAKDQLRQRSAFSWSQIMVVSDQDSKIQNQRMGLADYHDRLARNATGNFRTLLEEVTWHPIMTWWLSSLRNEKEIIDNGGTPGDPSDDVVIVSPDENYAREIKQLFSLGLVLLHPDGTAALSPVNGLIQETYNNDDIKEMSKIFTGFGHGIYSDSDVDYNFLVANNDFNTGDGNRHYTHRWSYPVRMFGDHHDLGAKNIVGGVTVDNTSMSDGNVTNGNTADEVAHGVKDIADVHDWLAGTGNAPYDGHQNTPAFLAHRLIQRQVTSNPTRGYIYRVAEAFRLNGGNLQPVIKAMLLDYEARSLTMLDDPKHGKKKDPILAYMQLIRALHFETEYQVNDMTPYGYTANQANNFDLGKIFRYQYTDTDLSMTWYRAETVFNFWLTDYSPSFLADKFIVGPEFMVATENNAYRNSNYIENLAHDNNQSVRAWPNNLGKRAALGYNNNSDNIQMKDQTTDWLAYLYPSGGSEWQRDRDMIDRLDKILFGGYLKRTYALDPANRAPFFSDVVNDPDRNPREIFMDALTDAYGTSGNGPRDKLRLALFLMTSSSSYLAQQ